MDYGFLGPRPTDTKATWHSHNLDKPHMEISCVSRLTLVKRILTWKESHNIHTFMRIFLIRKTSSYARNEGRFHITKKTQSPQKSRYA